MEIVIVLTLSLSTNESHKFSISAIQQHAVINKWNITTLMAQRRILKYGMHEDF